MDILKGMRRAPRLKLEDYAAKLLERGLNKDGTFKVDDRPMSPPIGYKKHPSMVEIMRDMIRGERMRVAAEEAGYETFEDADDFDVPGEDGEELRSGFENDFDPPMKEVAKEVEKERKRRASEKPADTSGGAGGIPPAAGGGTPPEAP